MPKHDHHWTFGNGCHIEFPNGGDPVLAPDHGFNSSEGCATFSDTSGNLLLYTDGSNLYGSASNAPVNPSTQPLGGSTASAHAAIVVPPVGGGSRYHIFAVRASLPSPPTGPGLGSLTHTAISLSAAGISIDSPPTPLTTFGPQKASEKLAAIPHTDCGKYWVVSLNFDGAKGTFYAMLIDSDAGPSVAKTFSCPYPYKAWSDWCVKFSPDGKLLASASKDTIDILSFDRATGLVAAHSQITGFTDAKTDGKPYGLEFSPNGKYLYFTSHTAGYIKRHTIGASSTVTPLTNPAISDIGKLPPQGPNHPGYAAGALQLAPNGKIYGTKPGENTLFEIGDPDNSAPAQVLYKATAKAASGGDLTLNMPAQLGLPTFTRISDDCARDQCEILAAEVDELLRGRGRELQNHMVTCVGDAAVEPACGRLNIPPIRPQTYISWGDSRCDCIEGDDTEIMHLTVCNPYSNLTLTNLSVRKLEVVDDKGQAVQTLPDGRPSIQLVPIGPYCYDDIAPCTCVTREFVLRLRGALPRRYSILVRGICFDACFHGDTEACFAFEVCRD